MYFYRPRESQSIAVRASADVHSVWCHPKSSARFQMWEQILICGLVVGVSTVLSVLGMLLVRSFVDLSKLKAHHEVAGYLLSVIGTLYAVLLAFVVVEAQSNIQQARQTAEFEANSIADIFHYAGWFPVKTRAAVRGLCLDYVTAVVDEEWDKMETFQFSARAVSGLHNMWHAVRQFEPVTEGQKAAYAAVLEELGNAGDNRRSRLLANHNGVSPLLWTVITVGGVLTITFTYFFGLENVRAQMIMVALVAITLSLNIFLVAAYTYPFAGEFKIEPDAFEFDQLIFKELMRKDMSAPD